jgi:hypothetical protein
MKQIMINQQSEKEEASEKIIFEKPYLINIKNMPKKVESRWLFNESYLITAFLYGMVLMGIYTIAVYFFGLNMYYSALIGMGTLLLYISSAFFMLHPRKITNIESTFVRNIAYPCTKEIEKPVAVYVDRPVEVEKIVEKEVPVEVEKEVVKFIERPLTVYVDRPVEVEKIVEKEVPVEVEKEVVKFIERPLTVYVDRPVEVEKIVEKEVPVEVEKEVVKFIERPVIQYIPRPKMNLNLPKYKYVASIQTKRFHKKSCRLSKLIKRKYKLNSNSLVSFRKNKFKSCKICLKQ